MNVAFPIRFSNTGGTAFTTTDQHIRDMIEELLFTGPGERVNRPDFGSGLMQLVFSPNSPELAAALQFTLQASLQRWLGDLIQVQNLVVLCEDSTLTINLQYFLLKTNQSTTLRISRTV